MGPKPPGKSFADISLEPESCGQCHPLQYADWSTSLHASALGPGVLGQLQDLPPADQESHQACLRCHAPLAEQSKGLVVELLGQGPGLHRHGVVCAACHVRNWQWSGPPSRNPSPAVSPSPHQGFEPKAEFSDAAFCSACHQFGAEGYQLNGKPLENTYQEWKESRFGQANQPCQSCHMPDRRHLFKGIHDAALVKKAVPVQRVGWQVRGQRVSGAWEIHSAQVGHRFPTYVTPEVVVQVFWLDAQGKVLPVLGRKWLIARVVDLEQGRELSDTRMFPGEKRVYSFEGPQPQGAAALRFEVRVDPDAYYRRLYRQYLKGSPESLGHRAIQLAYDASKKSAYLLFAETLSLP
ncbi:MAG: multiheme c-type cytochrome [bacterium]|nr:multiheme c-type cytochrome [bacterium]